MKYGDNRYQFTDKNHFLAFHTSIIPRPIIPSYRSNNPMITIQKSIIMKNDSHPLSQPTNNSPQITKFSCTIISSQGVLNKPTITIASQNDNHSLPYNQYHLIQFLIAVRSVIKTLTPMITTTLFNFFTSITTSC